MKSTDFRNDPLFLRNQFARDGTFELPVIQKTKLDLDEIALIGYDKLNGESTDKIVHFFLDDYKFEILWKDPAPRIEKLRAYRAVLSPQFSLYTEMPLAVQIHQTFKNRWCGAYFQSQGLKVIPSLVWGEADTFWFCFDGVDPGSAVAVSTVGMRTEKQLFMAGYKEMLRRLKPQSIICYGEPFDEMEGDLIVVDYAQANHLAQEKGRSGSIVKYFPGIILKGGGSAGSGGNRNGGQRTFPKFPGWDPTKCPGDGYEWRGRGTPESGKGRWFNPETGEQLYADLNHPAPLPPHWDYDNNDGTNGYRIFEDSSYSPKQLYPEGVVLK